MPLTTEQQARLDYLTQKITQLRAEQRILYELQAGRIMTESELNAQYRAVKDQIEPQEKDIYVKLKRDKAIAEAEDRAAEITSKAQETANLIINDANQALAQAEEAARKARVRNVS